MRKKIYFILLIFGALIIATLLIVAGLYYAVTAEPAFYQQALETDEATLCTHSDAMLRQTAALSNAIRKQGDWRALFTAEQINGWLAIDLPKNHPHIIPEGFSDPRVVISGRQLTIACRLTYKRFHSVLSLTIEPSVPQPNVLALRIVKARAGLVPVPLSKVLDAISALAEETKCQLQWRRSGGMPVALVSLPEIEGKTVIIEMLRLDEGELFISGKTSSGESPLSTSQPADKPIDKKAGSN